MLLNSKTFPHINSIAHEGKLVVFGTASDGKVWYTVKQDGFEDSYLSIPPDQRTGWENWKTLEFPGGTQEDASVIAREKAELTYSKDSSKFLLHSLYNTTALTAVAPVQIVSGLGHLYVFRQSTNNTLLVDRFVLDGLTNTLTRKLEVRYKRSRKRYEASGNQKNGKGALLNIDSLDYRDINGNDFYEPTTEICLVDNLKEGWFSVVLLPTNEQDKFRWHIFAYNTSTQKVEITSMRASDEGLFEVKDYTVLDPAPRVIPGILKRTLDLGSNAVFAKGLSAVRYDLQRERQTDDGKQLLRESVRVMLVYGTSLGNVAAVSFGVATDGTLAQIGETPSPEIIRSSVRQVLLPASSLEDVRAIAVVPASQGTVDAVKQGEDGDLVLQLSGSGIETLNSSQTIKVSASTDFNQVYSSVTKIDEDTFEITPAAPGVGSWEVVPQEEGIFYNGMITGYEKTATGKLRVTAQDHGLATGDTVQIVDTRDCNGVYTVTKKGEKTFSLDDAKWQAGTAINIKKLQDQKRRGIVFDGKDDYVALPTMNLDFSGGFTVEAWVRYNTIKKWSRIMDWGNGPGADNILLCNTDTRNMLRFHVFRGSNGECIDVANAIVVGEWMHVAATLDASGAARLYKNGQLIGSKQLGLPAAISRNSSFFGKSNWTADEYFDGQMAEIRVWNKTRTEYEIKNSMYLPLTGLETGLAGYWRLEGIVSEKESRTFDFSPNRNDGTVKGGAYISGRLLKRSLEGSSTKADKYINDELFAVTERAAYTEEFEFKLPPGSDPNNINGQGKIFSIAWRGKSNYSSRDWTPIPPTNETVFASLGDNWFKASATFTVPEGVSLVRMFGVEQVKGDWRDMEIRRHVITQVSDTITRVVYADRVSLQVLPEPQADRQATLKALAALEFQQANLEVERRKLTAAIKSYDNATEAKKIKQAEKTAKEQEFARLGRIRDSLEKQYNDGQAKKVTGYWKQNYEGDQANYKIGLYPSLDSHWNDETAALKVPEGLKVELYEHNNYQGKKAVAYPGSYPNLFNIGGVHIHNAMSSLKVMTSEGYTSLSEIGYDMTAYSADMVRCFGELEIINSELAKYEKLDASRTKDQTRLDAVDTALKSLAAQITSLKTAFFNALAAPAAKSMPVLANSKGLVTQGAALGFANPLERLQALETCEGNVQLSYFDKQGCMHQTSFDATADSNNSSFEQWLPDGVRSCLNFSEGAHTLVLADPVQVDEEWSLEAWFFYPLPEGSYCTLARGKDFDHHVLVQREGGVEKLGIYLNTNTTGTFVDSGFNMKTLSPGWHHLAAVASGSGDKAQTVFYIDGEQKGRVPKKTTRGIYSIGNFQRTGQPFGKLAEVRIWNMALGKEEITANSKVTLTGNEPGLLAYFPMADGSGTFVADRSGNGHTGTLSNDGIWWPCTAPIGNLGHRVMQFDGVDDHIVLPSMNLDFSGGFTVEAWVRYNTLKKLSRIIDWGNGPGADNILLCNADTINMLRFNVFRGSYGKGFDVATTIVAGEWMHLAATVDASGNARLYKDGQLIGSGPSQVPASIPRSQNYIGRSNWANDEYFDGQMAEVRVWTRERSQADIQANMNKRLTGSEPGLAACWRMNEFITEGSGASIVTKAVSLAGGLHGTLSGALWADVNTLPIAGSAVVSAEYSTIGLDARTGQKTATMRRCFAVPLSSGVQLFTDKRVEELELKWIGNGQFAPTLLGYIEGAPPLPSENLTIEENYNGATSVELALSEDVEFNWHRTQDAGLGASVDLFAGIDTEVQAGVPGLTVKAVTARAGFKGNLDFSYQFQNESSITASSSQSLTDKLVLRGTPETVARFSHLGKRFIPKNVGYALVVSALADVFVTRLARTKRMIGYQTLPVEGIPPDINTITFLINPSYIMNGSLDGMTGSSPTSQRFFRHVPAMRAQYGSLYPASYYRLQEAFDLKEQIEQQDKSREAYFAQFNSLRVDEAALEREIDAGAAPSEVGVKREEDKPGDSTTQEEKAAAVQDQAREQMDQQSPAVQKKNAEIRSKIADLDARAHASTCFASWQRKMEDIQIRAGKRNIVNTYVWDADGGLRSESQSFANTAEHTIGGSFMLNAGLGLEGKFGVGGVIGELTAQATVNMTQTMSKTESRSRGIELNVDLDGVESKGVTDYNDYPILPGEKVNRYRFMSFYLEGGTNNFKDFFRYVVDPEWLAGNSEEARALRQARGKPNKTWRVLHRVTYVERPALMGFGTLHVEKEATDVETRLENVQELVLALQKENKELGQKLDQILAKLNQLPT